ncbi:hypothetical protein CVT24_012183, partial [Panaeolus cyanescens]
ASSGRVYSSPPKPASPLPPTSSPPPSSSPSFTLPLSSPRSSSQGVDYFSMAQNWDAFESGEMFELADDPDAALDFALRNDNSKLQDNLGLFQDPLCPPPFVASLTDVNGFLFPSYDTTPLLQIAQTPSTPPPPPPAHPVMLVPESALTKVTNDAIAKRPRRSLEVDINNILPSDVSRKRVKTAKMLAVNPLDL